MFTILLMVFFIIALTLVAVGSYGVKTPAYQQGSIDGYRAGYHTAFNGEHYNVAAGLGKNFSYDDGYTHGYDEGYPEGQFDRENSPELKASQKLEASQINETNQDNETNRSTKTIKYNKISYKSGN
jgi:hypothetical protein